jgi:hypothetical protein
MNIKPTPIIATVGALLALGCSPAEPPKSELAERGKSTKPTLTSSVAPAPVETIEKKLEPVEDGQMAPKPSELPADELKAITELPTFEPELGSFDGLTIQRLVATSAIDAREPVFASSVFDHHDEKIYAFIEASNESEFEKTLVVHFIGPDGRVTGGIELRIPPSVPRWRTWAYTKNAKEPGLWHIEIRDPDGALIAALPFEVEPAC